MKPSTCFFAVTLTSLGLFAGVALAEEAAGKTGQPPTREQKCAENPKKCEEIKARMQEKCAQDPKRCEEAKARHAERKAKCDADPEACKKKLEAMRAHRQECRDKPETCRRHDKDHAPASKPPKV
jgi:hypothetical protein